MATEEYHLPPHDQLLATATCGECGASFSAWTWPTDAAIASPAVAVTVPVPEARARCPECGAGLPHPS